MTRPLPLPHLLAFTPLLLPPTIAYMSNTRRTHANSHGHTSQANAPSGSGSQATSATTPAPAKPQPQHTKFEIPLLDDSGDDYTHWCKTVTLVLKFKGLWDVVNGSTPTPSLTNAQAHLGWSQRDQEAHLQLILALSRTPCNHILNATTSKEV